uniref:serine hydrolase n=1 Tax=Pseudemcibacter sp. TaxID=2943293 RepID=UPI003F698AF3
MRKTIISRTVIAFALLLVSNIPAIAADIYDKAEVQNFIDGIMASNMDENNNASAVIKVMKDGDVIFSKGYGYIDQENKKPVSVDTSLFRPGSISKLFTWVSVM